MDDRARTDGGGEGPGAGGTDDEDPVTALYRHLAATAERPVDPRTNRWLGEAEAVARDAAESDLDPATTRKRVRQVARLLEEADATGDDEADRHVERARACCERYLAA